MSETEDEMSEPTTAAGRALVAAWKRSTDGHVLAPGTPTILAIEAEAVAAYRADLAAKVGSGDESTGLPHWHYARGGRDRADEVAGVFVERAAVLALLEGEPR